MATPHVLPEPPRGVDLIDETTYQAHAAGAARATDEVLRWAADEDDADNQIVQVMEDLAQDLADAGMRLRVVARWLVAKRQAS